MSTSALPRHIDREQVRQQLTTLGYRAGDKVFLRAFFPDTDPRKAEDKGRKAEARNLDQVITQATKFQQEGRGIYLVVNGGGHTNKDVTIGRAIFYEHDNLDKAAQIELWEGLGLPEPTLQIDTGGKSIHSYWVFEEPIAIEDWLLLQAHLLEFADADRSIKNASRVMRLAGAWHSSGNQSAIISNSGKRYSFKQLREIVPTPTEPTLFQSKPQSFTMSTPPLEYFLGDSKEFLNGVGEGSRNSSAFELACDAIGCANELQRIGQSFDGDAYQLLQNFAAGCTPPISSKEIDSIWKSAQSKNPLPSIKKASPNALENRLKKWERDSQQQNSRTISSSKVVTPNHRPAPAKLSIPEAADQAREILLSGRSELAINIELEELRQKVVISDYTWENKIIKAVKKDLDLQRYKSELLYIMAIADPIERDLRISQIAPKYQLQRSVIERNMVQMKERTTTPEPRLWSLSEAFSLKSEGLQWIVPELLPRAEAIIVSGSPKAGKSLVGTDLAFCVATGEERFLGQDIEQGKVLLVSVDESLQSTVSKLRKRGFREQDEDNIKILPNWDITQIELLEEWVKDYRPDVVIIDCLKRICKGSAISENSSDFSDNIYTLKEILTKHGAAGVLIHHSNKNSEALGVDRLRGSSAIAGSVWGVWQLDHIPKKDPNNSKKPIIDPNDPRRILSCFPRDAEGQRLDIELNLENNSWHCHGPAGEEAEAKQEKQTIRERLLRTLEKHQRALSGAEIIELAELKERSASAYSELNRMVNKKTVSAEPAPGNKRYTLYSLPNFCTVPATQAKKHTPPPPSVSLPNAIYESESIIEQGFQTHSMIHSNYIATDSTVTVESELLSTASDCYECVSGIDSKKITGTKGGGVEVGLQPLTDEPPVSELNQDELELVQYIRIATAEPDPEKARRTAADILPILKDVCARGAASREKVWAALTESERTAFSALSAPPIALADNPQEPESPQPAPEQELIAPADAEKLREIAMLWWPEYYPERLQTLITQMYGWQAPGTRYDAAIITAWLVSEDAVVRERITELMQYRTEGA